MAFAVEPYIFDWIFFDDSSSSKLGGFNLHGDRQQNVPLGCMSGRGSTKSERYRPTTNKKTSETMFQRVLLDFVLKTFGLGAENETLSICPPLCISSNCLCPVLYSQFEGRLGGFKVSFSSPTFAIQTSELQLLTTNLRIIFELTKSKRDGLYL